jgi:hypothetical protein
MLLEFNTAVVLVHPDCTSIHYLRWNWIYRDAKLMRFRALLVEKRNEEGTSFPGISLK